MLYSARLLTPGPPPAGRHGTRTPSSPSSTSSRSRHHPDPVCPGGISSSRRGYTSYEVTQFLSVSCAVSTYPDRTTVKPAAASGGGVCRTRCKTGGSNRSPARPERSTRGAWEQGPGRPRPPGLKPAAKPRPRTHPTADKRTIHPHQFQPWARVPTPGRGGASEVPGPHRPVRTATMQPGHGRVYVASPEPHSRRQVDVTAWSSMRHVACSPPARDRHGGLAASHARLRNPPAERISNAC